MHARSRHRQFRLLAALCRHVTVLILCSTSAAFAEQGSGAECREAPPLTLQQKFNFRINGAQEAFAAGIGPGSVIGDISLSRYNVFNLEDQREDNWLYRLANRINSVTWETVVRSQLLIATGDPYNDAMLAESERLLRELNFLYDARVIPLRVCGDRVDVEVITRDIWTLNPTVGFSRSGGENKTTLGLTDSNLLGSGKELGVFYEDDPDRSGYSLHYRDPAINDSRWTMGLVYGDNDDGYYRELEVERPFFSVYQNWATGGHAVQNEYEQATWLRGDEVTEFDHRYEEVRLFGAIADNPELGSRIGRWYGGLYYETNSFSYSDSDIPPDQLPEDRDYAYPFITYESLEDSFLKVRNMNYIARTEDFFIGESYHWTLGWSSESLGASRDQLAFDGAYQNTLKVNENILWRVQGLVNGYLDVDGGDFENLWMTLHSSYFHRQHDKWTFYTGARLDYTSGLTEDRQVLLGGDTGLRGYDRNYQAGDRSFVISLEERYYSDFHPFRLFRVGFAAFLDVGRAWYDDRDNGEDGDVLADIGFGLRLNSSRANKDRVIHLDVAFPLVHGENVDSVQFLFRVRDQF